MVVKLREVSFYATKEDGKLTIGSTNNRRILLTFLKIGEPATVPKIHAVSGVNKATVYYSIQDFVKAGFLKPILKSTHLHQRVYKYGLTDDGNCMALALSYDEKEPIGVSVVPILQSLFQPKPEYDAVSVMVCYALLNALSKGMTMFALRFLSVAAKAREGAIGEEWQKLALGTVEAWNREEKGMRECILLALANLTEQDLETVCMYFKGEVDLAVFRMALSLQDRKMMAIAVESQKDYRRVIVPFKCGRCRYEVDRLRIPTHKLIVDAFTGKELICPSCGKPQRAKRKALGSMRIVPQSVGMAATPRK